MTAGTEAGLCRGKCWLCSGASCGRTTGTGSGAACSHAAFSSPWGCGRRIDACCDSEAARSEKTERAAAAVERCSRLTRARRTVETGWPPRRRSNCRSAERSRRARSSRPPSPERRRTATASLSSGRFPFPRRRRLASVVCQTPATALHFCGTRCSRPLRAAPRNCVGGEGGCRCRSSLQIPARFPKCTSTRNWQVPSAPAGSKRSWDPLHPSLYRTSSRETDEQRHQLNALRANK